MNYKDKQEWIEAVMASDLGAATKVYAYGVFMHMYGLKDESFPSGKAISKATGLATGKFYLHNQALEEAGFLEVTHRRGRSNEYRLIEPTHRSGNPEVTPNGSNPEDLPTEEVGTYPQKGEGLPTEGVTPTHRRGTNTTSNTPKKTTSKKTEEAAVLADAHTVPASSNDEVKEDPISIEVEWDLGPSSKPSTPGRDSKSMTTRDLPTEGVTLDTTTTEEDTTVNYLILMSKPEAEQLQRIGGIYGATEEQIKEAATLLMTTSIDGWNSRERHEVALRKVGVEVDEW